MKEAANRGRSTVLLRLAICRLSRSWAIVHPSMDGSSLIFNEDPEEVVNSHRFRGRPSRGCTKKGEGLGVILSPLQGAVGVKGYERRGLCAGHGGHSAPLGAPA